MCPCITVSSEDSTDDQQWDSIPETSSLLKWLTCKFIKQVILNGEQAIIEQGVSLCPQLFVSKTKRKVYCQLNSTAATARLANQRGCSKMSTCYMLAASPRHCSVQPRCLVLICRWTVTLAKCVNVIGCRKDGRLPVTAVSLVFGLHYARVEEEVRPGNSRS